MSTAFDTSRPRTFNVQVGAPLDPTFGHQLEIEPPADQFNKHLTRYIYYPLDRIAPERKNELEQFAQGGDDIQSVCAIRTQGFLPKGKITPLEKGYRWMAPDNMVDPTAFEVEAMALPGSEHTPKGLALRGIPHYPGDEFNNFFGRWKNDRGIATGHTEIPQLLGLPWETGEVQKLNALFVPTGRAPLTLREVREDIERAASGVADATVKDIANVMLTACKKAEQWATRHINFANSLLAEGNGKFTYSYSSTDELFLAQLEIPRQDRVLQNQVNDQRELKDMIGVLAQQAIAANAKPQMTSEDMMTMFTANQSVFVDAIAKILDSRQDNKPPQGNQNRK